MCVKENFIQSWFILIFIYLRVLRQKLFEIVFGAFEDDEKMIEKNVCNQYDICIIYLSHLLHILKVLYL